MNERSAIQRFTTLEIVLMAVLAMANAVLSTFLSTVNQFLTTLGGPIATSTIVGLYMIYGVLAMYIIRKPGTAFITYMLGAIVQTLLGNSYGIAASLVAALCYAVAVELVCAIFKYKRWTMGVTMLLGLCAVPLWFIFAANMFGYLKWGMGQLTIAFIVRCLSGLILCGMLTKMIGDAMVRTGLLRSFNIVKDAKLRS
ncbi:hypothetical protein BVG16_19740 [Paenibacillus selenitireducens]|uniref:Uncharacterized protein n=1 Tax=Paenibacillus selenitireducens TaxID=1324314 RepID=A0A1T2X6R8_9BACL|nr:ECF transporter S component [Paenibacillus selenitireducens]OPA75577.1 hypothetical protein BVG16_19740 [Paenibacillus selenitireducens]